MPFKLTSRQEQVGVSFLQRQHQGIRAHVLKPFGSEHTQPSIDQSFLWLVQHCLDCTCAGMSGFSMGGVHASMVASLYPGAVACTPLLAPRSAAGAFCHGALRSATSWDPLAADVDEKQQVSSCLIALISVTGALFLPACGTMSVAGQVAPNGTAASCVCYLASHKRLCCVLL